MNTATLARKLQLKNQDQEKPRNPPIVLFLAPNLWKVQVLIFQMHFKKKKKSRENPLKSIKNQKQ